jgi:hypothetical protein
MMLCSGALKKLYFSRVLNWELLRKFCLVVK